MEISDSILYLVVGVIGTIISISTIIMTRNRDKGDSTKTKEVAIEKAAEVMKKYVGIETAIPLSDLRKSVDILELTIRNLDKRLDGVEKRFDGEVGMLQVTVFGTKAHSTPRYMFGQEQSDVEVRKEGRGIFSDKKGPGPEKVGEEDHDERQKQEEEEDRQNAANAIYGEYNSKHHSLIQQIQEIKDELEKK